MARNGRYREAELHGGAPDLAIDDGEDWTPADDEEISADASTTFFHRHPGGYRERLRALIEEEQERGAGFILAVILFGVGIVLYYNFPFEPELRACLILLAATALLYALLRWWGGDALAVALALTVTCGFMTAKIHAQWKATPTLGSAVATTLTGRVLGVETMANGRMRLMVAIAATERPELRYGPSTVRLSYGGEAATRPLPGMVVTGRAFLLPPSGPVRPGGFDFSFTSWHRGIGAVGFFYGPPDFAAPAQNAAWPDRLKAVIGRARLALEDHIRAQIEGDAGAVATALVVGAKAAIPEPINEALRRTGLAHILSISGLHMALVAGVVIGAVRIGFALVPSVAARLPTTKIAAACGLVIAFAYLTISGGSVATQRSFIMLAVMLIALLLDRNALTLRNLAIAAFIVLAAAPHEIMGPSFQMSFAATAALIAGYGALSQWQMSRRLDGPPKPSLLRPIQVAIGGILFTTLIAGAATGLYGAYHFHRIAPLAPLANVLAMPIVTFVTMPSAVVAHFLMPIGLDGPVFMLMGESIRWVVAIAEWVASMSGPGLTGLMPPSSFALLTFALVLITAMQTPLRLVALVPALAAMVIWALASPPIGFIAEDGRLVGIGTGSADHLAVNRSRPSAFVTEQWTEALSRLLIETPVAARSDSHGRFVCEEELCRMTLPSGRLIAQSEDAAIAATACGTADLLIIADLQDPASQPCSEAAGAGDGSRTQTVNLQRLALWGAASIHEAPDGSLRLRHAMSDDLRPWHAERIWSRPARGLPSRERD